MSQVPSLAVATQTQDRYSRHRNYERSASSWSSWGTWKRSATGNDPVPDVICAHIYRIKRAALFASDLPLERARWLYAANCDSSSLNICYVPNEIRLIVGSVSV